MGKYQLFKKIPPKDLVLRLLNCFGFKSFQDKRCICKKYFKKMGTIEKINILLSEIKPYYLPCKSKVFLTAIDEKKCITILRQLLKIHNYNVTTKEKCIKGEKFNYYQIIEYSNKKINTKKPDERPIVLSFD